MDVLWADPSNHCIQDLLATPRQLSHPVLQLVPRFTDLVIHVFLNRGLRSCFVLLRHADLRSYAFNAI